MRRDKTTGNTGWRMMLILFASLILLGHGTCMETDGPDEWGPGHGSGAGGSRAVTFTDEPSTDRPGMTYRTVHFSPSGLKDCKNLCRREAHCRAYTFKRPGPLDAILRGTCQLKNGVPAPVHNDNYHSGVKRRS